ncbi:MAG TPA: hypothetical protein GX510_04350 [Firmicutes bacterium]|nr:hypothetical protein [Candidatus Fermentithermobacillaceae bacterium]
MNKRTTQLMVLAALVISVVGNVVLVGTHLRDRRMILSYERSMIGHIDSQLKVAIRYLDHSIEESTYLREWHRPAAEALITVGDLVGTLLASDAPKLKHNMSVVLPMRALEVESAEEAMRLRTTIYEIMGYLHGWTSEAGNNDFKLAETKEEFIHRLTLYFEKNPWQD